VDRDWRLRNVTSNIEEKENRNNTSDVKGGGKENRNGTSDVERINRF
jgi:hypothetical protein